MDARIVSELEIVKQQNPGLKKLHKYQHSNRFFDNQFDVSSEKPSVAFSYLFDDSNYIIELRELVGKGAFSYVKKGFLVHSEQLVAVKVQNISAQVKYFLKRLGSKEDAERYVFNQLKVEDACLKLTGQFITAITRLNSNAQIKHYSIMRYIDGVSLKSIFNTLCAQDKLKCFISIVEQVAFLHDRSYLHLDIWPENILYSEGQAILHDYGCAAGMENDKFHSQLKGSHIPPEVLDAHDSKAVCTYSGYSDVYALGMTLYELLHDQYYDYSLHKTIQDFMGKYRAYHQSVLNDLSVKDDLLSQLLLQMITSRPEERISLAEVLQRLQSLKSENILDTTSYTAGVYNCGT